MGFRAVLGGLYEAEGLTTAVGLSSALTSVYVCIYTYIHKQVKNHAPVDTKPRPYLHPPTTRS